MRDAFGRLLTDPAELDLASRVDVLRRLAGELQADGESREARWLGGRLSAWLASGGDLERALGVKPQRGSRVTPQALVLSARRHAALLRLAAAAGSDALTVRLLQGTTPCPAPLADLLEDCRSLACPKSRDAIRRARCARHRR